MKRFTLLFFTTFFIYGTSISQTNTLLTLDDAISSAIASNGEVKLSQLDEQISKSKQKQTDAIFLPKVSMSYTSLATNNPLNAFGFKLQQKLISPADFDPVKLNHPSSTYDFTTRIELQQPIINLDLLYQRKAAAVQTEMYDLISRRTKEGVAFETEKAYLNLQWLYRVNDLLQQALATSRSVYKSTKDYFEQGLIQKSDLLNAEVYVSNLETQIKQIQSSIQNASDMLSLLMGKSTGTVYITDSIQMKPTIGIDNVLIPDSRPDLQAMTKGIDAYDLMINSSKMNYYPKLNAFASYQLNDKEPLGFKANSYLAGIQLTWNLFNGNRTKNTIAQQIFEKEKLTTQLNLQKEKDQVQINHARNTANDALYEIRKRELNIQQASEALRVLKNRYEQGLVKTTDILQSQTQLAEQKLSYIKAIYNYNIALATLSFLTNN